MISIFALKYRYQPLILIGAARSGTKLIRDLIAESPGISLVPYDINFIWRLGSEDLKHDELEIDQLTPRIKKRIRRSISRFDTSAPFLIEKTVSNCLRVDFVQKVFPEARFIHLVRSGGDVIESAYRQSLAPPEWGYILRKATTFPILDAPEYAFIYAKQTLRRLISSEQRKPSIWGPRYKGIHKDIEERGLLEVCALQWLRCLQKATEDLMSFPKDCVHWLRYEGFVRNPKRQLARLADFIGISPSPYLSPGALNEVRADNIGKGRKNFSTEQWERIKPYLEQADQLLSDPAVAQKFDTR